MYTGLPRFYGKLPKQIDLYLLIATTEELAGSSISTKHLRILAVLHFISVNEKKGDTAFADVHFIRSLIARITKKIHPVGDIRSFCHDLYSRGYIKKIEDPQHGTLFTILKKGRGLLSTVAQEGQGLPIRSSSPNAPMALN